MALLVLVGPVVAILPLNLIEPPTTAMILTRFVQRSSADKKPAYPVRDTVEMEKISPNVVRAILAAEDDAFYLHHGFDLRQIGDAIGDKLRGDKLRGASTISQQTAKNLFLWNGRSMFRKALEAYLTVHLELLLSKDRLLEIYLNLVECGDGYFGVEACARHHFKKSAAKLSREEAARLASILPNPRKRTPFSDESTARAEHILGLMAVPIQRD